MTQERVITRLHNNPPESNFDDIEISINDEYGAVLNQYEALVEAAERLPETINDEEKAEKVADYIKQLSSNKKKLDGARTAKKEPYLEKGRFVDGFFNKKKDILDGIISKAKNKLSDYAYQKEQAEKKRLQEEAEKKKREQEEALRKAAEAEAKAREEREKREAAEREAEAARKEQERLKLEAAAAKEREEKAKDEAKAAKERADKEEQERLKLEAEKAEAERKHLKAEADKARDAAKAKEEEAKAAKKEEKAASKESQSNLDLSVRSEKQAEKIERNVERDAQKGARVRGNQGSLSTVRRFWTGHVVSRDELDLEALRQHIPADALDKAVKSFVRAGGRKLKGASIYEDNDVSVR